MFAALIGAMMVMQNLDETGIAVARPVGKAILEPVTGSYFQVFEFYGRPPHTWRHATRMVKGYRHAGREGQLAFVKTGATHFFLVLNFDMLREKKMWIGLSAECNQQADLKWLDESLLGDGSFRAWSPIAQKGVRDGCANLEGSGARLPIFYDPTEFGVRWEVGRVNDNIPHMMVEFPVPPEENADDTPEDNSPDEAADNK